MDALTVHKEIEIDAPPQRVWPYVATQEGYRRWSCTVADVYDVVLEDRVGGRYEERGVVKGDEWVNVGRVHVYDPPRAVAFTFQTQREKGALSPPMTVTIKLIDLGGRTRVILDQTGFDALPLADRAKQFRSFDSGWGQALEELRDILVRELLPALGRLLVRKQIDIEVPPEVVWGIVATREGLQAWWTSTRSLVVEERVGGRFEIRVEFAEGSYLIVGRVVVYDRPRRFAVTWREVEGDWGAWPVETLVTFTLLPWQGGTRVVLVHSGFDQLPVAFRQKALQSYERGWTDKEMERLRALATEHVS